MFDRKRTAQRLAALKPAPRPAPAPTSSGLPSTADGALRIRWRRIPLDVQQNVVQVAVSAWRVTLWIPNGKFNLNGLPFLDITTDPAGAATPLRINPIVFGGAYYKGRPVYINERFTVSGDGCSLVIAEEYFDGYAAPGN